MITELKFAWGIFFSDIKERINGLSVVNIFLDREVNLLLASYHISHITYQFFLNYSMVNSSIITLIVLSHH